MDLEKLVHRLSTDAVFVASLRGKERAELAQEGYNLTEKEYRALRSAMTKRVPQLDWYGPVKAADRVPQLDWYGPVKAVSRVPRLD